MSKEKEMNPSSQMVFDMAKIFLDIETKSFKSGMKYAKEDAERERKLQAFADKCERDIEEKPIKIEKLEIAKEVVRDLIDVAKNQVHAEPNEPMWRRELHQLYGVEVLMEQAEEFLYEEE